MLIRSDREYHAQIGLAILGIIVVFSIVWFNVKNISIDKYNKLISFQNIFTRIIITYNYSDPDGYIYTFIVHGKAGYPYKAVGLVQGKRIIRRIDSFNYSNFSDLREAFETCNYLGKVKFGFWDRIKMLLNYEVLK